MKITKQGFAIIETDTHLGRWCEETGRLDHDTNTLPVILPLIKPGDVAVDAGAFIGDHAIAYARAVGEDGLVFAFEPNAQAYECLKYNMINFPQVHCYPGGLADKQALHSFAISENAGASHLINPTNGDQIQVVPLDSLQYARLNFFKLDIEGFELLALKGAYETIKRCRPIIMCELNRGALARQGHTPQDVISYLTNLDTFGYTMRKVFENESLDSEQIDVLFMP